MVNPNRHAFYEATVKKRYAQRTQECYDSHVNQWKIHIINHHEAFWDDDTGKLVLPLSIDVLKSFFDKECRHEDGTLKAQSTVNGYKTAIKNYYQKEKKLHLWYKETEDELESFLDGYRTRVADAKLDLILQKVSIDGARQVTYEDLERLMNRIVQEFRRAIDEDDVAPHVDAPPTLVEGGDMIVPPLYQQVADGGEPDPDGPPDLERWTWDDRIHPVPQGWQFPYKN